MPGGMDEGREGFKPKNLRNIGSSLWARHVVN
jgi:hypothetical protein